MSDQGVLTNEKQGSMNIYDLYNRMESNKVVLSFKGDVTSDLMTSILQIIEQRMKDMNEMPRLRKKVYNVLVECLQNLYHHIDELPSGTVDDVSERSAIFMISLNRNGYSITTGNYILTSRIGVFEDKLQNINSLDRDELKQLYKAVLNNEEVSEKGGAGLGMIDIVRKTGKKLNYGFIPLNNDYSFFSLNINVEENK
jgi:hypothetical protein